MPRLATVLARVANATPTTQRFQRRLAARHARVFRSSGGRRVGRWFGAPVLVLETVGRRSGERRQTPVIFLRDRVGLVVVAANGGADRVPAWWLNLEAAGRGIVHLDGVSQEVVPRTAAGAEPERLWRDFEAMYPSLGDYAGMTDRELPVVVLEPVGAGDG